MASDMTKGYMRRRSALPVIATALVAGATGAYLADGSSASASTVCANGSGTLPPFEARQLTFTNTYLSAWQLDTDAFWVYRRRSDFSIAYSANYLLNQHVFENSVDVYRRSEMGRENWSSYCCPTWAMAQYAQGAC
jgi:hypothetical protein